jgi:hypothetical protein
MACSDVLALDIDSVGHFKAVWLWRGNYSNNSNNCSGSGNNRTRVFHRAQEEGSWIA